MNTRSRLTDSEMATMVHGGATLDDVAAAAGISRERVRQRLLRIGVKSARRVDVARLFEVIRMQHVESLTGAAQTAGIHLEAARRSIAQAGLTHAVERLFRLRKRAKGRARTEQLIAAMRALAQRLGRTPTAKDLRDGDRSLGVPSASAVQRHFGSLSTAMAAAGLEANPMGGQHARVRQEAEDQGDAVRMPASENMRHAVPTRDVGALPIHPGMGEY